MKTRKVIVEFSVPAWFPTQRQIRAWYRSIKFFFFPFRCEVTGKRVNFKHPQYSYTHQRRVMISTHNHVRCRAEWIKYIQQYFMHVGPRSNVQDYWGNSMDVTVRTCNSCGYEKPTIHSAPDIRIGMSWWNGFHVCENCLVETVRLGAESSSCFVMKGKQSWPLNEAGVAIEP